MENEGEADQSCGGEMALQKMRGPGKIVGGFVGGSLDSTLDVGPFLLWYDASNLVIQ